MLDPDRPPPLLCALRPSPWPLFTRRWCLVVCHGGTVPWGAVRRSEGELNAESIDDRTKLLVRAHARDLLRHHLTQHRNHREAAVLELLQLLVLERLGIIRLEAKEVVVLTRHLG